MKQRQKCDWALNIFITYFFKCMFCKYWEGSPGDLWAHCPMKKGGKYWSSKANTYFEYMTDTQRNSKCQKFMISDEGYNRYIAMVKELTK